MDEDLTSMSREQLVEEIVRLRAGIRSHRDSSGHELCWFVPELWSLLPEKVVPTPDVPPQDEFLHKCGVYRRSLDVVRPSRR